jgi:hypothetical protein
MASFPTRPVDADHPKKPGGRVTGPSRSPEKTMYFIKFHPLKEQLRERTFTDRDGLPYYILFVASSTFMAGFPMASSDGLDVLSASAFSVATILGTIYSFKKNGGITGYDFIQKSIVLGWIIVFRCLWLFILAAVVIGYFAKIALGLPLGSSSWIDTVLSVVFMAAYYQRLGRHIQDTNRCIGEHGDTPDAAKDATPVIP